MRADRAQRPLPPATAADPSLAGATASSSTAVPGLNPRLGTPQAAAQEAYALGCHFGKPPLRPAEQQLADLGVHAAIRTLAEPERAGTPRSRARRMAAHLVDSGQLPPGSALRLDHHPLEGRVRVQIRTPHTQGEVQITSETEGLPVSVRPADALALHGPVVTLAQVRGDDPLAATALRRECHAAPWGAQPSCPQPLSTLNRAFEVAFKRHAAALALQASPAAAAHQKPPLLDEVATWLHTQRGLPQQEANAQAMPLLTDMMRLRHVRGSGLPDTLQRWVGVGRFPIQGQLATFLPDREYGLAFCQQSHVLGSKLRSGELDSFDALWRSCRDWRVARAMQAVAADPQASAPELFAQDRQRTGQALYTMVGRQYDFMGPRVLAESRAERSPVVWTDTSGDEALQCHLVLHSLQARLNLGPEQPGLPLTRVLVWATPEGDKPPVSPLPEWHATPDIWGVIDHTQARHIGPLRAVAQQRFEQMLGSPWQPTQPAELVRFFQDLGALHWLLAHACLDMRGSAAKSELAVRALALCKGVELPPFRAGVVPDLEAMLLPEAEFSNCYLGWLEAQQAPALPINRPDAGRLP